MEKIRSLFSDIRVFLAHNNSFLRSRAISYAIHKIDEYIDKPNSLHSLEALGTALKNCGTYIGYGNVHPLEYQFSDIVETGGQYISIWIRHYKDENRDTFVEIVRKYAADCIQSGSEDNNDIIIELGQFLNKYVARI